MCDLKSLRQVPAPGSPGDSPHGNISAAEDDEALNSLEAALETRKAQLRTDRAEHDRRVQARAELHTRWLARAAALYVTIHRRSEVPSQRAGDCVPQRTHAHCTAD
jgi:hypothetical protein